MRILLSLTLPCFISFSLFLRFLCSIASADIFVFRSVLALGCVMEKKRFLVFVLFVCLGSWSYAQEGGEAAPMEKTELVALFSAIQGFVGNSWNGSDLYPDPCGWTPIQVILLQSLLLELPI